MLLLQIGDGADRVLCNQPDFIRKPEGEEYLRINI